MNPVLKRIVLSITGNAMCVYLTHLSRVLINIYVNDSSVFVALLNDVVLDLGVPAWVIFPEKEYKNRKIETMNTAQPLSHNWHQQRHIFPWFLLHNDLRLGVEQVGQLQAVCRQGL